MLVAKNQHAASQLNGAAEKAYFAVVCGRMEEDQGTVEAPIRRINEVYTKRMVSPDGQYAKTDWEVLSRGEGYSLLRLRLSTGRTHQIRVHMAHIGHPLAGDDLYGGDLAIIPRQALHCGWVRFPHPVTRGLAGVFCPSAGGYAGYFTPCGGGSPNNDERFVKNRLDLCKPRAGTV